MTALSKGRDRRLTSNAVAWRGVGRSVVGGAVVAAVLLVSAATPRAQAQEEYGATVANDTEATASSNAEIRAGDIVTGYNSGNQVSTADSHQGTIIIDGGNFLNPTQIDFLIDSGTNDAYADGGLNDASTDGPETDLFVSDDLVQGDGNTIDESSDTEDSFNSYDYGR